MTLTIKTLFSLKYLKIPAGSNTFGLTRSLQCVAESRVLGAWITSIYKPVLIHPFHPHQLELGPPPLPPSILHPHVLNETVSGGRGNGDVKDELEPRKLRQKLYNQVFHFLLVDCFVT
jgi:hypothetical protein